MNLNEVMNLHVQGDLVAAERGYRELISAGHKPSLPQAYCNLALICAGKGALEEACALWGQAIQVKPGYVEAHFNLARVQHHSDDLESARANYEATIKHMPEHIQAWYGLGQLNMVQGDNTAALRNMQRCVAIQPSFGEAQNDLGHLLQLLGRGKEAGPHYERAVAANPAFITAYLNLGIWLQAERKIQQAIEILRKALQVDPNSLDVLLNLGNALLEAGQLDEAISVLKDILSRQPGLATVHNSLGNAYNRSGQLEKAHQCYEQAIKLEPEYLLPYNNLVMNMNYMPSVDLAALLEVARRAGRVYPRSPAGNAPYQTDASRALKIAYVSGDLRQHPVGYFLLSVLAAHRRDVVTVYCYSNNSGDDATTESLRSLADYWRDIGTLDDDAVAEMIRQDGIDVLIDLSGHTYRNRLGVFAQKPAPVQASWLGYFASTGLEEMDYVIADRYVVEPGEERYFCEEILRMPGSYLCFSPPEYPIAVSDLPVLAGDGLTFGCFNNRAKLTRETIETWAELMNHVPDSRLLLKYAQYDDKSVQRDLRKLFEKQGIAAERLLFRGQSERSAHLACYQQVDIALDPFPYGGGTTTAEALWMGVPVVTRHGDRWTGRVSESILAAVGLEEMVAQDSAAYVSIAVKIAEDTQRLQAIRRTLREKMLASPLCDGSGFTANLEALYLQACQQKSAVR